MRALIVIGFFLAAGPALALSCTPHRVDETYAEAEAAADAYRVVHGVLHFDERLLPRVDMASQDRVPPETRIPARITGQALGRGGFVTPFAAEITLEIQCFGPWCAGAGSDMPYLAFLRQTREGYALRITPCGGFAFAKPSQEALQLVISCQAGGPCLQDLPH